MSVVKINALTVPAETGDELVNRFAPSIERLHEHAGFERFSLLKPSDGRDVWFVFTQWADEEAYEAWKSSRSFASSHARGGGSEASEQQRPAPVATSSELLEFVTTLEVDIAAAAQPGSAVSADEQ